MNRRDFAALIALGALPRAAFAQETYRVAVLIHGPQQAQAGRFEALRAGLKERGYVEGRNLVLSVRWNEAGLDRLPGLAAKLMDEKPQIFACGPVLAAAAAQQATRDVPIVAMWGAGLVKTGLAKSFARPAGNVTGLETQTEDLIPKHLELLKTIAPRVSRVAVLNTGKYLFHQEAWRAAAEASRVLRLELIDVRIAAPGDVGRLARTGCNGLYVMPDPQLVNWRAQIIAEAARLRWPAIYPQQEFSHEGGLASYSASFDDLCRRAAGYVDRILRGAKPAELPIELASKFDLVIDLRTAGELGLKIPDAVLARADQVIR